MAKWYKWWHTLQGGVQLWILCCPREQRIDELSTKWYPSLRTDMVPPVGDVVGVGSVKRIFAIVQRTLPTWWTKSLENTLILSKEDRDQLNIFLPKDEEGDKQETCVHRQWFPQTEFPWIDRSCDLSIASSAKCLESCQPPPLWHRARSNSQESLHLPELTRPGREEGERLLESQPSWCLFFAAFAPSYWWKHFRTLELNSIPYLPVMYLSPQ